MEGFCFFLLFLINNLVFARTCRENPGDWGFAPEMLQHQRPVEVGGAEGAVFAYFGAAAVGEAVEAEIIFGQFDFGEEFPFEGFELHQVDLAFEDGFLDALADAFADLGDAAQASAAGFGFGIHVVADDDEHGGAFSG